MPERPRAQLSRDHGGAHFLEHIFYMGTPTRKHRQSRDEIMDRGGSANARTDFDRIEYWTLSQTRDWKLALDGLADGARNALLDPTEVEKERSVIVDELRQRLDDNSLFGYEELARLAFQPHPYARRRGGELDEIAGLTREHLLALYRRHYRPDRLVLIITGDVDTAEAVAEVRAKFGDMPRPATPLQTAAFVPPDPGFEHRFFERETEQTYVCVGVPAPATVHADAAACDLLFQLLHARLNTELVLTRHLASAVWGGVENLRDLGFLQFCITAARHTDAPEIERVVYQVIGDVAKIPTGRPDWDEQAELAGYQRQQRLSLLFDRQDATARGVTLAWGAVMGTLEHLANYGSRIDAVTLEDIGRCARTYCAARQLNCVVVGPAAARASAEQVAARDAMLGQIAFPGAPAPDWSRQSPTGEPEGWQSFTLANGLRVLVQTATEFPLVTVGVFTPSGSTDDPLGREGRAWLANTMLLVGTAAARRVDGTMGEPWDRARISQVLSRLGFRFHKGTAREHSYHAITVARSDLATALDLFSAGYVVPTYPAHELPAEQEGVLGSLRSDAEDPVQTALRHARRRVYGEHHPYAIPTRGRLESVPELTQADLFDGYFAGIKPQGAVLVFHGDLTAREAHELARAAFGHWNPVPPAGTVAAPLQGVVPPFDAFEPARSEHFLDKEQAAVMLACPAVAYGAPEYPAADVARALLGDWAFKELIYDKKIGYSTGCSLEVSRHGGGCFLFAQCKPETRDRAVAELRALVRRLTDAPVPVEDLRRVQRQILGGRPLQLQTGAARVFEAGGNAILGLAPDYTDEYLAAVEALTPAALHEAVRAWLDPERLAEVHVHRDAPREDR